jgi:hypothetical protein
MQSLARSLRLRIRLSASSRLQLGKHPALHAHLPEDAVLLLNESQRRIALGDGALVKHDNAVVVNNLARVTGQDSHHY